MGPRNSPALRQVNVLVNHESYNVSSRRFARALCRAGVCPLLLAALVGCPGDGRRDIEVDGHKRSYFVYTPSTYDGVTPMPAVIVLHGAFNTATRFREATLMDQAAEDAGFIAIYPQALSVLWHPVDQVPGNVDDVKYIAHVLDEVERDFAIDTDHVYATGFSLGGVMTYRLACDMPDRIAGIAPVASGGIPNGLQECAKQLRGMPFMLIQGDEDPLLPFAGRVEGDPYPTSFAMMSVDETFALFAEKMDCWSALIEDLVPDNDTRDRTITTVTEYLDCNGAASVALYTVHGGGHAWPGSFRGSPLLGGPVSKDYEAAEVVLGFFSQFVPAAAQ